MYVLPKPKMANADLARIINSDEVQSVVRPIKKEVKRKVPKKNPLRNLNLLLRLNPYAETARRAVLLAEARRLKAKKEKLDSKRKQLSKVLNFVFFFVFHDSLLFIACNQVHSV